MNLFVLEDEYGHIVTKKRHPIWDFLISRKYPASAGEVKSSLKEKGIILSRKTVTDELRKAEKKGLLNKKDIPLNSHDEDSEMVKKYLLSEEVRETLIKLLSTKK